MDRVAFAKKLDHAVDFFSQYFSSVLIKRLLLRLPAGEEEQDVKDFKPSAQAGIAVGIGDANSDACASSFMAEFQRVARRCSRNKKRAWSKRSNSKSSSSAGPSRGLAPQEVQKPSGLRALLGSAARVSGLSFLAEHPLP